MGRTRAEKTWELKPGSARNKRKGSETKWRDVFAHKLVTNTES